MAKAKASVSKRKSVARLGRRRPYEYDHQYGLRVEASPRRAKGSAGASASFLALQRDK